MISTTSPWVTLPTGLKMWRLGSFSIVRSPLSASPPKEPALSKLPTSSPLSSDSKRLDNSNIHEFLVTWNIGIYVKGWDQQISSTRAAVITFQSKAHYSEHIEICSPHNVLGDTFTYHTCLLFFWCLNEAHNVFNVKYFFWMSAYCSIDDFASFTRYPWK